MIKIDADYSEVAELAADLVRSAKKAWPDIIEATRASGDRARDTARALSRGAGKGAPDSIRSVVSRGDLKVTARVEYGSKYGAILEFGTPSSSSYPALGPGLDLEGSAYVTEVEDIMGRAFSW